MQIRKRAKDNHHMSEQVDSDESIRNSRLNSPNESCLRACKAKYLLQIEILEPTGLKFSTSISSSLKMPSERSS